MAASVALPEAVSVPEAASEPSLGSALIANGFFGKSAIAVNDPLAAIRRLTQVEKIALFS